MKRETHYGTTVDIVAPGSRTEHVTTGDGGSLFGHFFDDWEFDVAPWNRRMDVVSFPAESYVEGNTFTEGAKMVAADPDPMILKRGSRKPRSTH